MIFRPSSCDSKRGSTKATNTRYPLIIPPRERPFHSRSHLANQSQMATATMNSCLRTRSLVFSTTRGLRGAQLTSIGAVRRAYGTVLDDKAIENAPITTALEKARTAERLRHDWTKEEIKEIYNTPLMLLSYAAVCSPCRRTLRYE